MLCTMIEEQAPDLSHCRGRRFLHVGHSQMTGGSAGVHQQIRSTGVVTHYEHGMLT